MTITKKRLAAMATIVLLGFVGAAAVLVKDAGPATTALAPPPIASAPLGQVHLSTDQQTAAGITTELVALKPVRAVIAFPGEVRLDEERTAHVVPRYAGVVESVAANLGQRVRRGQVLAVLTSTELAGQRSELLTASKRRELARSTYEREQRLWAEKISAEQDYLQARNALQEADIAVLDAQQRLSAVGAHAWTGSLNRFELRAPFDATVVDKHMALGEAVKEDASVFTLSDLSSVWVSFAVSPQQLASVEVGARVEVRSTAFARSAEGTVSYVGAVLGAQTRTATARVTLPNRDGIWRPGLFVTVSVFGAVDHDALAVSAAAVQTIDGQPTVFVANAAGFIARAVKPGRSDGTTVEILSGLHAGERVAVSNSFVLKAELGKAAAAGD